MNEAENIPQTTEHKMTDFKIEQMVSVLLRTGVLIAATVVIVGGILFLVRHGGDTANYHQFASVPTVDRHVGEIARGAFSGRAPSIIQLGILLLIATPIARVVLALFGFAMEGDRKYMLITAVVLAVLLFSLISGALSN